MQQRRHEIDIHKDMLKAQIKSAEEERQTVRYVLLRSQELNYIEIKRESEITKIHKATIKAHMKFQSGSR